VNGNRQSFADGFRSLNRGPFAVGLIASAAGVLSVVGQALGTWSWLRGLLGLGSFALGAGLIVLYYRLRDERSN